MVPAYESKTLPELEGFRSIRIDGGLDEDFKGSVNYLSGDTLQLNKEANIKNLFDID